MERIFKFFATNKTFSHTFFIGLITITLSSGYKSTSPIITQDSSTKTKSEEVLPVTPFAVVELFTSEGCSSCPSADKLLTEIVKQAEKDDLKLFALSFHVDYWDYLGWKDPFAKKEYTNRQRRYSRALGSGVYTPQMVINGSTEFVGSDRSEASYGINYALNQSESEIKISDISISKRANKIKVNIKTEGSGNRKIANIALVERGISIDVKRGENRGRKLSHDNVVKSFKSISLSDGNQFDTEIVLPEGISVENSSVIVYVQDLDNLKIFDAYGSNVSKLIASK